MGNHSSAFRRTLIISSSLCCLQSSCRSSLKPPGTTTSGSGFPRDRGNAGARSGSAWAQPAIKESSTWTRRATGAY
ncbi:hypothetical protein RHGRI_028288 [Rhododendron griersonianum]|uniref:Secreted protein n=1 Tax=Rhododendron griersonianum TaxID=479676 RepID=A0AAV6IFR5_9ERIC|nr:hypothetical protein RHGRI_028288 [Rhododendron griersonianum]